MWIGNSESSANHFSKDIQSYFWPSRWLDKNDLTRSKSEFPFCLDRCNVKFRFRKKEQTTDVLHRQVYPSFMKHSDKFLQRKLRCCYSNCIVNKRELCVGVKGNFLMQIIVFDVFSPSHNLLFYHYLQRFNISTFRLSFSFRIK